MQMTGLATADNFPEQSRSLKMESDIANGIFFVQLHKVIKFELISFPVNADIALYNRGACSRINADLS